MKIGKLLLLFTTIGVSWLALIARSWQAARRRILWSMHRLVRIAPSQRQPLPSPLRSRRRKRSRER